MEKKSKVGALFSGISKTAKTAFDNVVQVADQNDDGKFDLSDISSMADTVGNTVKKGTQAMKISAEETARAREEKTLQPIFLDDLNRADFSMSKFIRVVERDKKYATSEVCRGAIGHGSDQKGLHIINIFRDSIEAFKLTFYPDYDSEFYYVDPSDKKHYIALAEYFGYLKVARINELKKIAQDLGAKYFKVTYKEEEAAVTKKKGKTNVGIKAIAAAGAEHDLAKKEYARVSVEAETEFSGHPPVRPQLKYMQRDPSIQALISLRMDEKDPLLHENYKLELSKSSGIKFSDAVKIDAVLKGLKYSGNTTVESEVQNESRSFFEYEIKF